MYIHSGHNFEIVIHLCIIACSLLVGSVIRSKVRFFQKYLIPAPMIGGLFLFAFYNWIAGSFSLNGGREFLEELMFHLLNISFIAMQLRIPTTSKTKRKAALTQNLTALLAQYGLQGTFGLLAAFFLLRKWLPGSAVALGETLCLGFELGPGQAESITKVWESAPYFVKNAGDVGLAMAAIGFVVGSVVGVFLINRAAKKGWIPSEYVEKLRSRKVGNGFFRNRNEQLVGSKQTTAQESMDTMTLHLAIILFTYLLSFLVLAGIEFLVKTFIGGKVVEAVEGLWGINFVISSLCAILVRKVICASHAEHVIDNGTCNRISGLSVDFTIAACLGAIEVEALRMYAVPILVLSVVGILITCVLTPVFCSRLFDDFSFFRFLMIFGSATGTLPTALSLVRVVDPDFETPVAQDYVNSTGLMFVFALPILAFINWPAMGMFWQYVSLTTCYIVLSFILYIRLAGKRAFAKGGYFYCKNADD